MTPAELLAISREPNAAAFLRVIRACEGTAGDRGYQTIFGYEYFDDFSRHPNRTVTKGGYSSSAAGAYQIINKTWAWLVTKYGFTDFTPETQDAAAVALLIRRNALDDVRAGRLEAAVGKCGLEWASLPGSPYGQPVRSLEFVRRVYRLHGGVEETIANRHEAEAVDTRPNDAMAGFDLPNLHTHTTLSPADNSAKLPIKPMAPVIAALLPSLVSLIPELGKLFSSGSDVSERNVAATRVVAERVAEIVTNATAAPNLQGAVETMQADPAALDAARAAVRREYFELQERTTADARKFVSEYGTTHNVRTVVGRFTFPELLSLVFIGLASLGVGYLMHTRQLSGELLGGVVTLMLIGGWTEIRKFWFGLGAPEGDQKRGS